MVKEMDVLYFILFYFLIISRNFTELNILFWQETIAKADRGLELNSLLFLYFKNILKQI